MKNHLVALCIGVALMLPAAVATAQGIVPCNGPECQACHLVQLGDNIIDFLIFISAAAGAIVFAFAGLQMATAGGNAGQVSAAKSKMTNVIIGFIIMLAAWLIVDTIMKAFAGGSVGVWNQIECVGLPEYSSVNMQQLGSVSGGNAEVLGLDENGNLIVEINENVRSELAGRGILVNKGECPSGAAYQNVAGGCTSVSGLSQGSINTIVGIKNGCGSHCEVVITGGNEAGHQTHGDGNSIDIRFDSNVDSYIQSKTAAQLGASCVRESDHWHCRQR